MLDEYTISQRKSGKDSAYGDIHFGHRNSDKLLVAVKFNNIATIEEKQRFARENHIMHKLAPHPGIIKPLSGISNEPFLGMVRDFYVMERAEQNLPDWLYKLGSSEYSKRIEVFMQICNALEHAHSKKYVHRDLHCHNVLLNTRPSVQIKLVDFGRAYDFNNPLNLSVEPAWGRLVIPPEVRFGLIDKPNNNDYKHGDVFSLGILLKFLFTPSQYASIGELLTIQDGISSYIIRNYASIENYLSTTSPEDREKAYKTWLDENNEILKGHYTVSMMDEARAKSVTYAITQMMNFDTSIRCAQIADVVKLAKSL